MFPYNESAARNDPAIRFRASLAQAMEDIRPQLTVRFSGWQNIPRLQNRLKAFGERMVAVSSGKRARVDFKRIFARFLKERLPDFPVVVSTSDLFRCAKPIDEKLTLLLEWDYRHAYGLGKMLELQVGARWDSPRGGLYYAVPRFFGWGDLVSWAYVTKEELEECLNGAADFLTILTPSLGDAIRRRMDDPAVLEGPGAITARQAYELARPALNAKAQGVELVNVFLNYSLIDRWGPPVSLDGRLRAHGSWVFQLAGAKGSGATADVPFVGAASVLPVEQATGTQERVHEPWIDSNQAIEAVGSSGRIPKEATLNAMALGHGHPYTNGTAWRMGYVIKDQPSPVSAVVDAALGEVVVPR